MLELFTDGSCLKNPGGAIGYAAVLFDATGAELGRFVDGAYVGTNNTAELLAVITALEQLPAGIAVTVFSDSQYVVRGMTEWIAGWKRKKWLNVKNPELWQRLDRAATKLKVQFQWVRGHNGNPRNVLVDRLAHNKATQYLR